MFIGHFAVGFGAKKIAPLLSLGTLFLAAQFLDLLWPTFVLLGLETVRVAPGITAMTPLDFVSYPISHSLLTALGWSVLFGAAVFALRRHKGAALVAGVAVLSHWILDYLTHRPDLPLTPGGEARVGLNLWGSILATVIVEGLLFAAGVFLYARATVARDRKGRYGFAALVVFLAVVYLVNIFGPPPPSASAVAWGAQAIWLLVLWGYWIDRHRRPAGAVAP